MNEQIDIELQAFIGRLLLKVQKFEFLIHGLVSHFKPETLDKTFMKGMSAEIFLSSDPSAKKKRKQTLGQVFSSLKTSTPFLYWQEMDTYLENRNSFIHNFWRDYISKNFSIRQCKTFLTQLDNETDEWTNVFRGLLSVMAKGVISREGRTSDQIEEIKKNPRYQDLLINEACEKYFYDRFKPA